MIISLCFLFTQSNFLKASSSKLACGRVDSAILIKLDFVARITAKLYMSIYKFHRK